MGRSALFEFAQIQDTFHRNNSNILGYYEGRHGQVHQQKVFHKQKPNSKTTSNVNQFIKKFKKFI